MKKDKTNRMKKNPSSDSSKKTKVMLVTMLLLGIILVVCAIILQFVSFDNKDRGFVYEKEAKEIKDIKCLKKGNVCSFQEIYDGIKIKYAVNDKETYEFYLISNDEDTATYIMANTLEEMSSWAGEIVNFKGPTDSLYNLNTYIKDWKNVPLIESYSYKDFGYQYYQKVCVTNEIDVEGYDCSKTAGYQSLEINDGKGLLTFNLPSYVFENLEEGEEEQILKSWNFEYLLLRARLITKEEVDSLVNAKGVIAPWLVDHMKDGDTYWTLSSDPYPTDFYLVSAFMVRNNENHTNISMGVVAKYDDEGKPVANGYLRPVITLKK